MSASPWGRGDNGKLDLVDSLVCDWCGSSPQANRRMLIFVNTRDRVKEVSAQLSEKYTVEALHGELAPEELNDRLKRFREGLTTALILTDAQSRWLDRTQTGIVHDVVNLDLPADVGVYLGRVEHAGSRRGDATQRGQTTSVIEVDEEGRFWDEPDLLQTLPAIVGKANVPEWLLEHSRKLKATGMCGVVLTKRPVQRRADHSLNGKRGGVGDSDSLHVEGKGKGKNGKRPMRKPVSN